MSRYSDPLCDVCGQVFPPGWESPARFHRVWEYADFDTCERCLQALIMACDLDPVRRDARDALSRHREARAVISAAEHSLREAS